MIVSLWVPFVMLIFLIERYKNNKLIIKLKTTEKYLKLYLLTYTYYRI